MKQDGAALLVTVLVIVTVAAFAVVVAATQSGGGVQAIDATADSHQVLLVADSALERQLKRFATGTACSALGDDPGSGPVEASHTITDLSTIGLGTAAFTITLANGFTTDFAGVALGVSQCRISVTARSNTSNVSRAIHAIVDKNLLSGANNHTFNNIQATVPATPPTGWTLAPAGTYTVSGGPDGVAPACSRSAWTWKSANGAGAAQRSVASGTTAIPVLPSVTVGAGSTTTVYFHRRAFNRDTGCAAYPGGAPAFPCGGDGLAGGEAQVCFRLTTTAGGPWTSARRDIALPGANIGGPGAACPIAFNPCSAQYAPAYPTKDSLAIAHPNTVTLNGFTYYLRLQNGGRRELFVDNIEAVNNTALNAAHVRVWRDCSTAVNPAACT